MNRIEEDIAALLEENSKYKNIEEIQEFINEWENKMKVQTRNDTNVYKETMKHMNEFKKRIDLIPEKSPRFNTITFECITLKK